MPDHESHTVVSAVVSGEGYLRCTCWCVCDFPLGETGTKCTECLEGNHRSR